VGSGEDNQEQGEKEGEDKIRMRKITHYKSVPEKWLHHHSRTITAGQIINTRGPAELNNGHES